MDLSSLAGPQGGPSPDSDPHGSAALLLVESLIHGLAARSILSVAEAVEVIVDARDVQANLVAEAETPTPSMQRAVVLLDMIANSMKIDLA